MSLKGWEATRLRLKKEFERKGITYCQLRFEGCWVEPHGFAHSLRRRKIKTQEELEEVVLACNHCHNILDNQSIFTQEQARDKVREIRNELS